MIKKVLTRIVRATPYYIVGVTVYAIGGAIIHMPPDVVISNLLQGIGISILVVAILILVDAPGEMI